MNTRKIVGAIVISLCATWLVACDADPSPQGNEQTSSPTPSSGATRNEASTGPEPSTTKSSTAYIPASAEGPAQNVPIPKMPSEAKANTKNGAKTFALHYFDLINYVGETNNTEQIKKVTSTGCKLCATSIIDPADQSEKMNEWQVGGKYDFDVLDVFLPNDKKAIISTIFNSSKFSTYTSSNDPIAEYSEINGQYATFELKFDDGWKVTNLVLDES